jgi:membrane protein YdbS with pleckstrin-like domain
MKKELKLFDKPENVRRLLICFYISLVLLVAAEFFIHKHPGFPWESSLGFFAVYGFVSNVLLIFIAKLLRLIVLRKEKYYDQ